MTNIRRMQCCTCGGHAGSWQQHWNRDSGFGICRGCVEWVAEPRGRHPGLTPSEIADCYGVEGVNYARQET